APAALHPRAAPLRAGGRRSPPPLAGRDPGGAGPPRGGRALPGGRRGGRGGMEPGDGASRLSRRRGGGPASRPPLLPALRFDAPRLLALRRLWRAAGFGPPGPRGGAAAAAVLDPRR